MLECCTQRLYTRRHEGLVFYPAKTLPDTQKPLLLLQDASPYRLARSLRAKD